MNDAEVVAWLDEHCLNGWDMYPCPFGTTWGWAASATVNKRHEQGKGLTQPSARHALACALGMGRDQ